jgi:hypothetical protein
MTTFPDVPSACRHSINPRRIGPFSVFRCPGFAQSRRIGQPELKYGDNLPAVLTG